MSNTAISIEGVWKQYQLGKVGTGNLSQDLKRFWYKIRKKEDPFLAVSESNDRTLKSESQFVWALQDVSFKVNQGEIVGIIGRNGAGKSTLLKILSRVTSATKGEIKIRGRISSLLEVGTGFHPDLSGRENIILNGAILGMRKAEIMKKFDEIVDFSGVERYIDTPVKRYSSGMYVRLAFAVAAHLEPEILIVDEVLAVGDLEFQKKCLGKMQSVSSNQGRTVLFVSHNLSAVRNLCQSGIVLSNGSMGFAGNCDDAINYYRRQGLEQSDNAGGRIIFENFESPIQFSQAELIDENSEFADQFEFVDKIGIKLCVHIKKKMPDYVVGFTIEDEARNLVCVSTTDEFDRPFLENKEPGSYNMKVVIPEKILKPGFYNISITARGPVDIHHKAANCLTFQVIDTKTFRGMKHLYRKGAMIAPEINWSLKNF
jgi:lipopolysaccharide transport system ATP-binding protein